MVANSAWLALSGRSVSLMSIATPVSAVSIKRMECAAALRVPMNFETVWKRTSIAVDPIARAAGSASYARRPAIARVVNVRMGSVPDEAGAERYSSSSGNDTPSCSSSAGRLTETPVGLDRSALSSCAAGLYSPATGAGVIFKRRSNSCSR